MKKLFINIILMVVAIILRLIIIVSDLIYYTISAIGDFIMGILIISGIGFLIMKDYDALQLNIIALVVMTILKFGIEVIVTSLHYIEEWIDEYRCGV